MVKHTKPGDALKQRKKSHENQAPLVVKNLESLKEKQRNMMNSGQSHAQGKASVK